VSLYAWRSKPFVNWPLIGATNWTTRFFRGLTFEVRQDQREDARPAKRMIDRAASWAWWLAVGPRLDRGVRPHTDAKSFDYFFRYFSHSTGATMKLLNEDTCLHRRVVATIALASDSSSTSRTTAPPALSVRVQLASCCPWQTS